MARRHRTPEGEAAAIRAYVRVMSEEGRENLSAGYFAMAASMDALAAGARAYRAKLDEAGAWATPGTKRSAARRANSYARQATIYRANALAYGMQHGPVEPEGVRTA